MAEAISTERLGFDRLGRIVQQKIPLFTDVTGETSEELLDALIEASLSS